ncbi:GNAT family N-acetyltransferase [Allostreptomyces psammosilenae]|uniref:RimJ/RimL family protein N-acetyltransferase n=1 Tax=Allostreptomyces psammosilenae TaxID=1892865 RepID=A0A852ZS67_9ACTN|nr:GNAT family N-acetyltransferase [Allostreptomyces psammosilenae]NYI04120.1 RimJ/RimL family protein N-acetyltransferase [Allostreptomyces psammosilenae]
MPLPDFPWETTRLTLRPFRPDDPDDLDDLHAYRSRPDVHRYLYTEPADRADSEANLRKKSRWTVVAENEPLVLAAEWRATGRVVGEVNLVLRSREHRQGEIGYVFHPDFHGRGFATEASRVMLAVAFDSLGLHRVCGRLDARNTASARVLERLGMRREAHLRENEWVKGEWTDEVVYAMLAREWAARRDPAEAPRQAEAP